MLTRTPRLALTAFKKIKTPLALQMALDAHIKLVPFERVESPLQWHETLQRYTKGGIYSDEGDFEVNVSPIPEDLQTLAYKVLTPEISKWATVPVVKSWGYGVREYTKNSRLMAHRDRVDSHILSAIVHVSDVSNTPWPLDFVDQDGVHHEVFFDVGETLLYESFCPHARAQPFDGLYYRNCYFHWRPENWDPEMAKNLTAVYPSLDDAITDVLSEQL